MTKDDRKTASACEAVWDTTSNDWALAEQLHPGCSAAWDRDGGPAWTLDEHGEPYPNLTICVSPEHLAIGCNDHVPFRWAIWNEATEEWIFVSPVCQSTGDPLEGQQNLGRWMEQWIVQNGQPSS